MIFNRYGYVWCPECDERRARAAEIEPLPRCKNAHWMEPMLCDEVGCEEEAVSKKNGLMFCPKHTEEEAMAA